MNTKRLQQLINQQNRLEEVRRERVDNKVYSMPGGQDLYWHDIDRLSNLKNMILKLTISQCHAQLAIELEKANRPHIIDRCISYIWITLVLSYIYYISK